MEIPVPENLVKYKIEIAFDISTGVISLVGCEDSPLVSLAMLDYALARVRRAIATTDMMHDMGRSPLLHLPGGALS